MTISQSETERSVTQRAACGDEAAMEEIFSCGDEELGRGDFEAAAISFRHAAVVFHLQAFRGVTPKDVKNLIEKSISSKILSLDLVIASYVNWIEKHPHGKTLAPIVGTGIDWTTLRRSFHYNSQTNERLAALRYRFDRICESAGMVWEVMAASPLELHLAAYFAIRDWRWEEPRNIEQRIIIDEFAEAIIESTSSFSGVPGSSRQF